MPLTTARIARLLGMVTAQKDGANVRVPPPLVYLGGVILGLVLQRLLPLPIGLVPAVRIGLTAVAALAGVGLMAGAIRLFRRTGQDPKPWKGTPEIVSAGVYRFTRNPMYLGMALVQASIGIALANGWIVVLLAPVLVLIHASAIRHEEAYLESKFGEEYRRYKASVRRWL